MRRPSKGRKSILNSRGKEVIKSPYNKVNEKDINFVPKPKKKRIKGFPSDKAVEAFLRQLTFKKLSKLYRNMSGVVNFTVFKRTMNEVFSPQPDEELLRLLFQRFKPLKFSEDGKEIETDGQEMVVLDMLIALALLSRVISKYNDKLRIIFNF